MCIDRFLRCSIRHLDVGFGRSRRSCWGRWRSRHETNRLPAADDNGTAVLAVSEKLGVLGKGIGYCVGEADDGTSVDGKADDFGRELIVGLLVGVDLDGVSGGVSRPSLQIGRCQLTLGSWAGR